MRPSAFLEGGPLPDEGLVLEWKSPKSTFHVHWFPMRETQPGGDPHNNLYAPGGILAKYDLAFGRQSRAHELSHGFRPFGATGGDADWAGHCDNAAEVASLLAEPRRAVSVKASAGDITFSPHEVKGLLVLMGPALSTRIDFRGVRYNGPTDDVNDPSPWATLEALRAWGRDPRPFVIDVARGAEVWNYPYDQVKVQVSKTRPASVHWDHPSLQAPPSGARYLQFRLSGTGYEDETRTYHAWVQGSTPEDAKSGWLVGEDQQISPDFLWRPTLDERGWGAVSPLNPEVHGPDVRRIYEASIG